jgi:hypothetical protein
MGLAYFMGYQSPSHHADPLQSLGRPIEVMAYFFTYLGNLAGGENAALALGVLGTGALALLSIRACRLRRLGDFSLAVPVTMALFVCGAAFLTALGRLNFPLASALENRYVTPVALFWTSLVVGILGGRTAISPTKRLGDYARAGAAAVLVVLVLTFTTLGQAPPIAEFQLRSRQLRRAADALLVGVADREALLRIHPEPSRLGDVLGFLKSHRRSIFARDEGDWLGQRLGNHFEVDADRCTGWLDGGSHVPGAYTGDFISGWAWDIREKASIRRLLFTDESGTIVGLASGDYPRPDVPRNRADVDRENVGWEGYARKSHSAIRAYGLVDGGRKVCEIGGRYKTQDALLANLGSFSGRLLPVDRSVRGVFVQNGYFPGTPTLPGLEPVFASWKGDDKNVGELRMRLRVRPSSNVLNIPFLTGPSAHGLLLAVEGARAGRIATLSSLPASNNTWRIWTVFVPNGESEITVVASDEGKGWGQWLGVGPPFEGDASSLRSPPR